MGESLGEFMALATAIVSLAAAVGYWLRFAALDQPGPVGAGVKTVSTGLLAVLVAFVPGGPWFWLVPLGLGLGALGDLFLALRGERFFLAGVGAFGLGHLAYAAGLLLRSGSLGFDGLAGVETVALAGLVALLVSTEFWLAPRTGALRWPVRGYVVLIGLTGVGALLIPAHPGQGWLRLGAAFFIASDLMLAIRLFVARDGVLRQRLAHALWPAYWLGQALIAWGAVVFWQAGWD
jgi:uncharacterized membrane protein YhhN